MPPRIRKPHLETAFTLQPTSTRPLPPPTQFQCLYQSPRSFSSTPASQAGRTLLRREMFRWLNGPGRNFKDPLPGSTNYLTAYTRGGRLLRAMDRHVPTEPGKATEEKLLTNFEGEKPLPKEDEFDLMPFPNNRQFRSQNVLSEELREEIWRRVVQHGKSVRVVSVELGVDMNRVGAVVRLKEIEKRWIQEGRKLSTPYAKAVMSMLPITPLTNPPTPHEPINDLPTHPWTRPQIFHPVPESTYFTRTDAAKVFNRNLLPAEKRIPHPELIEMQKEMDAGLSVNERMLNASRREDKELGDKQQREERERREREEHTLKVQSPRWEFRFREVSVEDVGRDGRSHRGVGWRYGFPHQDRKGGQVKIPTRVE
ncbi:MAG: hypothetical protein M1834_006586 [Cirrosporium novae-zelandiae]|nr:MAG: hypothetical protein M1834_006586 [Cirrosporium novae-zelandiae]